MVDEMFMLLWIGGLILILLVFLIGPSYPKTPIGTLYWFLTDWIWTSSICGRWLTRHFGWIMNEKHILVQLFYLSLMLISFFIFGLTTLIHWPMDAFPQWH